jgi:hypothetical protein
VRDVQKKKKRAREKKFMKNKANSDLGGLRVARCSKASTLEKFATVTDRSPTVLCPVVVPTPTVGDDRRTVRAADVFFCSDSLRSIGDITSFCDEEPFLA